MNTGLILASVLMNCTAQIFMRQGMIKVGEIGIPQLFSHALILLSNIWLWASLLCYGISVILWLVVVSRVEISYAYPFLSIGYVVVAISGYMLFGENVNIYRISGILVICFGVFLISRS